MTDVQANGFLASSSPVANPIIPGFHPDPSICRVGDDYYLVNSSFEYLPGVPIFHSRDLVTWEQIGNVLDRDDQLSLASSRGGGGIYAPTLRHHDGRFWMVTTNVDDIRNGHLIVSADDPAGPWSAPVRVPGAIGIDPDLAWDDGNCYLSWSAPVGGTAIVQARIDIETGRMLSEPQGLWAGSGLAHPEGPHLYRHDDWWYLLLAEGGTERGHAVTVARSRSIDGPFESHPANPIFSHRSTRHPVQNTGHADLVETADGEWAAVYLGVRPGGPTPRYHVNGRETFIAGVRWEDDWPVFDEDRFHVPEHSSGFDEDFSSDRLAPRWISPGLHPRELVERHPEGGLRISAPEGTATHRPLLATRVEHAQWEARAAIRGGAGRLTLRLDDAHWASVEVRSGSIEARVVIGPVEQVMASAPAGDKDVHTLAIRARRPEQDLFQRGPVDFVDLGYVEGADFRSLACIDGRYLSSEVAGGFTGRVVGIEPLPDQPQPAHLLRFTYRPTADETLTR